MLASDKLKRELLGTTACYQFGALALPFAFIGSNVAAAAGATVATQATVAAALAGPLGQAIGGFALFTGLSALSYLLAPAPAAIDPANGQLETQQPLPGRTFVYGRMEVSGATAMKKKAGNETSPALFKIIMVADGEIDAFETIYGDDRVCTLDVDGFVNNGPFTQTGTSRCQVFLHTGSDSQAADAFLLAAAAANKLYWTSDHRLRGIAYAVINAHGLDSTNFPQAFPHGEPQFKFTIRGRRVWDMRDGAQSPTDKTTWLYSDNPALCIHDWVSLHPKGYRIDRAKFDTASFIAMANLCDELVPLSTGGSEKRYRVATEVNLRDEKRADVLARLRQSCDAHLYKTGAGTWAIRGGAWVAPTVTVDTELGHIIEAEMSDGVDMLSRYNEAAITYLEPDNHYANNECDPWQQTSDTEWIAGRVQTQSLSMPQVPSFSQARRLAKIISAQQNPTWIGSVRTNYYGLNCVGERVITLNWSEPDEPGADIDGAYLLDQGMSLLGDGTGAKLSVRRGDSASYNWTTAEEGTVPSILPPSESVDKFTDGTPPTNPTDFAATAGVRYTDLQWTAGADEAFYIARVWRATTTSFANAVEVSGPRYREKKSSTDILMKFRDPIRSGTYRYWLTVENYVGDRATPVGPLTATVS